MPDIWVDEALPPLEPAAGFVAVLRAELEDELAGVQTVGRPARGRHQRRRTAAALAALVIAAAAVAALVVRAPEPPAEPAVGGRVPSVRLVGYLAGGTWTLLSGPDSDPTIHRSLTFARTGTSVEVDDGCSVRSFPVLIDEHATVLGGPAVIVTVELPDPVPVCRGVPANDVMAAEGYRLAGSRGVLHLQLTPLTTGAHRGVGVFVLHSPDLGVDASS